MTTPRNRLEPVGFDGARMSSDAELARTLLESQREGSLSTLSVDQPGYPFGSVMPYSMTPDGDMIFIASDLAEHARNFKADPRASLMVAESIHGSSQNDPLAMQRVTILGDIAPIQDPSAEQAYLKRHKQARRYAGFADFSFYALNVASVRFVGGFGRMSWVSVDDYRRAEPDPTPAFAEDVIQHMNADHGSALLDLCRGDAGLADVTQAQMLSLDRYGLVVRTSEPEGSRDVRISFQNPIGTAEESRVELIRVLTAARKNLLRA